MRQGDSWGPGAPRHKQGHPHGFPSAGAWPGLKDSAKPPGTSPSADIPVQPLGPLGKKTTQPPKLNLSPIASLCLPLLLPQSASHQASSCPGNP